VRKLGQHLLANPVHAMGLAILCVLIPVIGGFLAAMVVGFVTLCRGYKTGLLVLAGVALPVLVIAIWKQIFLLDMVLVRCALVWLLAGVLGQTVSWRLVLEIMTILGVCAVLAFHLLLSDPAEWIASRYQLALNAILGGQISADQISEFVAQIKQIGTGLFIASPLLGAFCQLLAARWWQAAIFHPGGLAKEFVEIRAGLVIAAIFTVTAIGALCRVSVAIDCLPVVILPLAINGLSLLHKWVLSNRKIIYLLIIVYIGFVFLPVAVVLVSVLALAGYVDSWYDLRKRYLNGLLPK
jgi:hypothetical protein